MSRDDPRDTFRPQRKGTVRLHPKHGVNPTIPVCYWCGEPKNEVVLLGSAYKKEAPQYIQIDKEPCSVCLDRMKTHVMLIRCIPNIGDEHKRTGEMVWVDDAWIKAHLNDNDARAATLEKRIAFICPEGWKALGFEGMKEGLYREGPPPAEGAD